MWPECRAGACAKGAEAWVLALGVPHAPVGPGGLPLILAGWGAVISPLGIAQDATQGTRARKAALWRHCETAGGQVSCERRLPYPARLFPCRATGPRPRVHFDLCVDSKPVVLAEHTAEPGNFASIARRVLERVPEVDGKTSFTVDPYVMAHQLDRLTRASLSCTRAPA